MRRPDPTRAVHAAPIDRTRIIDRPAIMAMVMAIDRPMVADMWPVMEPVMGPGVVRRAIDTAMGVILNCVGRTAPGLCCKSEAGWRGGCARGRKRQSHETHETHEKRHQHGGRKAGKSGHRSSPVDVALLGEVKALFMNTSTMAGALWRGPSAQSPGSKGMNAFRPHHSRWQSRAWAPGTGPAKEAAAIFRKPGTAFLCLEGCLGSPDARWFPQSRRRRSKRRENF